MMRFFEVILIKNNKCTVQTTFYILKSILKLIIDAVDIHKNVLKYLSKQLSCFYHVLHLILFEVNWKVFKEYILTFQNYKIPTKSTSFCFHQRCSSVLLPHWCFLWAASTQALWGEISEEHCTNMSATDIFYSNKKKKTAFLVCPIFWLDLIWTLLL